MRFILPWSLFWRWGSVPPFNLVGNKKASGLFRSLAMESKVFYSCFAANFSATSSRRSKVCFSAGYQDHFFAGYDFFRAIVYDTIPVDNHRQTGIYSPLKTNLLFLLEIREYHYLDMDCNYEDCNQTLLMILFCYPVSIQLKIFRQILQHFHYSFCF